MGEPRATSAWRRPLGIAGAVLLYLLLSGKLVGCDPRQGLGRARPERLGTHLWRRLRPRRGVLAETIATFIFVFVILRVTGERGAGHLAGLVVGLTLVLLHLPFVNVTGLSVNPARSFGPALRPARRGAGAGVALPHRPDDRRRARRRRR